MDIARLLLDIGRGYLPGHKYYQNLIKIYCAIFGILIITLVLCGDDAMEYMLLSGHYDIVNFLIAILYLTLALIPPSLIFYFLTLIVLGLGQIVENTSKQDDNKQNDNNSEKQPFYAPQPTPAHEPTPNNRWTCSHCFTENSDSSTYCIACMADKPNNVPSSKPNDPSDCSTWICKHCNTLNSNSRSQCRRCGREKS